MSLLDDKKAELAEKRKTLISAFIASLKKYLDAANAIR